MGAQKGLAAEFTASRRLSRRCKPIKHLITPLSSLINDARQDKLMGACLELPFRAMINQARNFLVFGGEKINNEPSLRENDRRRVLLSVLAKSWIVK